MAEVEEMLAEALAAAPLSVNASSCSLCCFLDAAPVVARTRCGPSVKNNPATMEEMTERVNKSGGEIEWASGGAKEAAGKTGGEAGGEAGDSLLYMDRERRERIERVEVDRFGSLGIWCSLHPSA